MFSTSKILVSDLLFIPDRPVYTTIAVRWRFVWEKVNRSGTRPERRRRMQSKWWTTPDNNSNNNNSSNNIIKIKSAKKKVKKMKVFLRTATDRATNQIRTAKDRATDRIQIVTDQLQARDVLDHRVIRREGVTERRLIAIRRILFLLKREKFYLSRPHLLLKNQKNQKNPILVLTKIFLVLVVLSLHL